MPTYCHWKQNEFKLTLIKRHLFNCVKPATWTLDMIFKVDTLGFNQLQTSSMGYLPFLENIKKKSNEKKITDEKIILLVYLSDWIGPPAIFLKHYSPVVFYMQKYNSPIGLSTN